MAELQIGDLATHPTLMREPAYAGELRSSKMCEVETPTASSTTETIER